MLVKGPCFGFARHGFVGRSEGPSSGTSVPRICTSNMFHAALENYSAAERRESLSKTFEGTIKGKEVENEIMPGINYNLSACAGKWAYMNDEGSTYVIKGYRIGCEDPIPMHVIPLAMQNLFHVPTGYIFSVQALESHETCDCFSERRTMPEEHVSDSQRGQSKTFQLCMGRTL